MFAQGTQGWFSPIAAGVRRVARVAAPIAVEEVIQRREAKRARAAAMAAPLPVSPQDLMAWTPWIIGGGILLAFLAFGTGRRR